MPKEETVNNQTLLNWFVALGCGVLVILFVVWILTFKIFDTWGDRGTFGDTFGVANALFTGLAFGGVIIAIFLQKKELELQRVELSLTRQELKLTRDEVHRQATAQGKSAISLREQAFYTRANAELSVLKQVIEMNLMELKSDETKISLGKNEADKAKRRQRQGQLKSDNEQKINRMREISVEIKQRQPIDRKLVMGD